MCPHNGLHTSKFQLWITFTMLRSRLWSRTLCSLCAKGSGEKFVSTAQTPHLLSCPVVQQQLVLIMTHACVCSDSLKISFRRNQEQEQNEQRPNFLKEFSGNNTYCVRSKIGLYLAGAFDKWTLPWLTQSCALTPAVFPRSASGNAQTVATNYAKVLAPLSNLIS